MRRRLDVARIVLVGLGNDHYRPVQLRGECLNVLLNLSEYVFRRIVFDGLHRVEPQTVEVVFANPKLRVLHHVAPYVLATDVVVVDGVAPGRLVMRGEVRTKHLQVIALGAEVVVDNVEDDGQAKLVRRVDEAAECAGPAIVRLHGVGRHAVVAPVARARRRGNGHDLDHRDAQVLQILQLSAALSNVPCGVNVPTCSS